MARPIYVAIRLKRLHTRKLCPNRVGTIANILARNYFFGEGLIGLFLDKHERHAAETAVRHSITKIPNCHGLGNGRAKGFLAVVTTATFLAGIIRVTRPNSLIFRGRQGDV